MLQYVAGVRTAAFVTVYAQIYILVFFMFSIFVVPKDVVKTAVVARKDTPSCSQHVSFSQFFVNSPKLKNVYLRCDRLDRTDDFDAFELLGQHIRKESTDGSSPHTSLVRSVPSANLLQLCHVESPFNRTNREEKGGNLTETQL